MKDQGVISEAVSIIVKDQKYVRENFMDLKNLFWKMIELGLISEEEKRTVEKKIKG